MADKIKEAYQSSKDIYDEVLTQGNKRPFRKHGVS